MVFAVGDKVKIREWDDMAEEYGYEGGNPNVIACRGFFLSSMRPLCGMQFTIRKIYGNRYSDQSDLENAVVSFEEEPKELYGKHGNADEKFLITTAMIELVEGNDGQFSLDESSIQDMIM